MRLSTIVRYGFRAVLDIASNQEHETVTLSKISERQNVSSTYLRLIIKPLMSAGLIRSNRGPKGGFFLSKPASEITLSDIWKVLDGPFTPVDCINNPDACTNYPSCVTRDIWIEIRNSVNGVLLKTTLRDLIDRQNEKGSICKVSKNEPRSIQPRRRKNSSSVGQAARNPD
jgi:Rrf2 family protein